MSRPEYYANEFSIFTPESRKPEIHNPIGQPLVVTWQENGQIQFRGCKDYEEMRLEYNRNAGKTNLKCVKSVVLTPTEVSTLAQVERIQEAEKAQREVDEKEYNRLKEKLGY